MKKLIVVADWADDSLTCQEIRSAVGGFLQSDLIPNISFVGSTPSTIHTSYILKQVIEIEERYGKPLETVIFQNTDPRIQTSESVQQSKGAELVVIRLKTGIYVLGPNAGFDFSLIKPKIEEIYRYPGMEKGSQFRSRDLYSRVSAHLMEELEDEMDLEETHTNIVPELTGFHIGHIDNYGNIKTTITQEDLKGKYNFGDILEISINGTNKKINFVSNLFGGTPGALVIYPGSSGDKVNRYLEISVWRHFTEKNPTTGYLEFNKPTPGTAIELF